MVRVHYIFSSYLLVLHSMWSFLLVEYNKILQYNGTHFISLTYFILKYNLQLYVDAVTSIKLFNFVKYHR